MVVGKGENLNFAFVNFSQDLDPVAQVRCPVQDDFVPRFGFFLDALAVADPADIRKIRSDRIEALE